MPNDLRCLDDLDLYGAEVSDVLEALRQDCYHRLLEPLGSNLDLDGSGLGLPQYLSAGLTIDIGAIRTQVEFELLKDPRVSKCVCTIQQIDPTTITLDIQIKANEQELGIVLTAGPNGLILSRPS